MEIQQLKDMPLPPLPDEFIRNMEAASLISLTDFSRRDCVLTQPELQTETGYRRFPDDSWLLAFSCPLPGLNPELLRWWLRTFPKRDDFFRGWYPGAHADVSQPAAELLRGKKSDSLTLYTVESFGQHLMPLKIEFVPPTAYGLSREALRIPRLALTLGCRIGLYRGALSHSEGMYLFLKEEKGMHAVVRFWLGCRLTPVLRRRLLTEDLVRGTAEHAYIELARLPQILPELSKTYGKRN